MKFLDVGIMVGLCLVFLKGIDLILREHHRIQIQSFFETLTLESEYFDQHDILGKLRTPGAQAFVVSLSYFVFAVIVSIVFLVTGPLWTEDGWLTETVGKDGRSIQIVRAMICAFTLGFAWRWPIPALLKLLVPYQTNIRQALIRLLLFYFGMQTVLLIYLSILHYVQTGNWNIVQIKSHGWSMYTVGELLVWPIYVISFVTALSVCIGVLARIKPMSTSIMISIFRGFLWRIIEFEKGATAAIVLIITVVLSFIRIAWSIQTSP